MAQSGNGIDLGAVYRLLMEVAETVRAHSERFDRLERRVGEVAAVLNDHGRQLTHLQADMIEMRQAVTQYHAAVTSQGIHYSELEGRPLRIERHLKLEHGE